MTGTNLLEERGPVTQSLDAVKAFLAWKSRASDPLPTFVEIGKGANRMVLVLSNKRDCFYVATAAMCSCPAHNWHPNQICKHQRKYFPEATTKSKAADSIKVAEWAGGRAGPVDPDELKAGA
jgi:hypothetical protein